MPQKAATGPSMGGNVHAAVEAPDGALPALRPLALSPIQGRPRGSQYTLPGAWTPAARAGFQRAAGDPACPGGPIAEFPRRGGAGGAGSHRPEGANQKVKARRARPAGRPGSAGRRRRPGLLLRAQSGAARRRTLRRRRSGQRGRGVGCGGRSRGRAHPRAARGG